MRKILTRIKINNAPSLVVSMMVKTCADTQTISSFINDLTDFPYLAEEKRNVCEGIVGYDDECYNVLQTFQKLNRRGTMV